MIVDVIFKENDASFDVDFGEVYNISDGGFERGYEQGHANGYALGEAEGTVKGYRDGYDDGYALGDVEGTERGYAEGHSDGKQAEYDRFWDTYQDYGNRTNYKSAFSQFYWITEILKPKYTCKVVEGAGMFDRCFFEIGLPPSEYNNLMDISHISIDVTEALDCDSMFANARVSRVTLIFGETIRTLNNAFTKGNGGSIGGMEITLLVPNSKCTWNNTFSYHRLKRLTLLEGTVIGTNNFNVSWATALPHDDLMSILNALEDKSGDASGTTWTVTIGSANKAKLAEEELEIANMKGWNVN